MMTATVVTTDSRTPIADALSLDTIEALCNAQTRQEWGVREPHGQLWERVAETPTNAPAPLTARQDEGIVRAYVERYLREPGGRGPLAAKSFARIVGGGIIRAGERIA